MVDLGLGLKQREWYDGMTMPLRSGDKKYVSLSIQSPCQMMIGVYNHLLSKVSRFHRHSQVVIGSLGFVEDILII